MSNQKRIGFIGLGIMGHAMATNLLASGFALTVWNRSSRKAKSLVAQGADSVDSPAEVARQAEIILLCVSDAVAENELIFGQDGIVKTATKGTLIVDLSTIPPKSSRQLASELADLGLSMLDSPVSGSREGADQGSLSVMVGGKKFDFKRALPVLETISSKIVHVGESCGDGQAAKLVNQLLAVGHTWVMCEALVFAQASGVDLEKTLEAVTAGAAGSWMLTHRAPQVIRRDWTPGFTIDLQQKSNAAILDAAADLKIPTPLTKMISKFYTSLQEKGLGGEGHHALVKVMETISGVKVGPI